MTAPTPDSTLPPPLSKAQLLKELAPFARPSNAKGLALTIQEYVIYWGAIALVLFAPWMTVKVIAGAIAGFKMTAFYSLGHEAGHRALVSSKRLNWWLAQLLAIPAWQNQRLWILDHNLLHHPKTNGPHHDLYQPLSKEQFDSMSKPRQLFERIIRAPNVIGFVIAFLPWMISTRLVPTKAIPKHHHRAAWLHFASLAAYQAAFVAFLWYAPNFAPVTAMSAVMLGFVLPFFVFALVTGASLYLMHNNRRLPWFNVEQERKGDYAPELCAMHMTLPDPLHKFIHNVFAHSAHHAHAGIPAYHLLDAQKHLDKLLGARGLVEPMTVSGALATMKACKLYDYDKHQWLDFDGNPTAPPINLAARAA